MQRILIIIGLNFFFVTAFAQSVSEKLTAAFKLFEGDGQLQNGIASLYVIDAKTGKVVFDKNGSIGLAPASTQKIITAASAYELLGNDYRYKTVFGYSGTIENGEMNGQFVIKPSGDPTLGSWRWNTTREGSVAQRFINAVRRLGINTYMGIVIDQTQWNSEAIPDGWIWQDIGNYYGAGAHGLNWRENQYDVLLRSGNTVGSEVEIIGTKPTLYQYTLQSELKSAAKGTGDNAYIYFPIQGEKGSIRGTIPLGEERFSISGAIPSPAIQFASTLKDSLRLIKIIDRSLVASFETEKKQNGQKFIEFHTETSPPLDSIIYWFNRRSINLYGEALVKTIAQQKKGNGSTDEGVGLIKEHWKTKGISSSELNMVDGSGLSPLNRVTTKAQVNILKYARTQPWFAGFYHSLPEFNGMKMKSGTIRGVKGYCGYHKSKDGNEYVFSFLVNNYNGSASGIVQKMYKVLDVLK